MSDFSLHFKEVSNRIVVNIVENWELQNLSIIEPFSEQYISNCYFLRVSLLSYKNVSVKEIPFKKRRSEKISYVLNKEVSFIFIILAV